MQLRLNYTNGVNTRIYNIMNTYMLRIHIVSLYTGIVDRVTGMIDSVTGIVDSEIGVVDRAVSRNVVPW